MGLRTALEACRTTLKRMLRTAAGDEEIIELTKSLQLANAALAAHERLTPDATSPLKVRRWVRCGELSRGEDIQDVYNDAGRLLDKAYAHEILGTVLFEGEDGVFYTITTEAVLGEAEATFVKEILEEV